MKKVQYERRQHEKIQHGNNVTWPKCNTKIVQHEKRETWKNRNVKKCKIKKVTRVKYGKKSAQIDNEPTVHGPLHTGLI